jgi:hypothetical protein
MLLSLLIPTLASRHDLLRRLEDALIPRIGAVDWMLQYCGLLGPHRLRTYRGYHIELVEFEDDGELDIGSKRNVLSAAAIGDYQAFIDDDDLVADQYPASILEALQTQPACVGFRVKRTSNGKPIGESINSLAMLHNGKMALPEGRTLYLRTPNHLNPIRRELIQKLGPEPFPKMNHGEDQIFAAHILPILRGGREVFIDQYLYHYEYRMPDRRAGERTNDLVISEKT